MDRFYDYRSFPQKRIEEIFKGWDGLGGYHGLLIKLCAPLAIGHTVLDVGCGLCHLYTRYLYIKSWIRIARYVGIDKDLRILGMAKTRYPELELYEGDVYDLSRFDVFDTVFAIGLYSGEPKEPKGIDQLIEHAKHCVILTFFAEDKGSIPKVLQRNDIEHEFIIHNIDERLEVMRLWKL